MKHLLPKTALEHHIGIVGKTGSGKTSITKSAIVEPALDAGERVCTIDPTGAWWGLRLKADGKSKGYPVVIFGGRHADKPLLATHGELLAEFIGKTSTPCVIDTSLLKSGERMQFFTDFADTILRTNETALRLIIDEAHVFMPQAGTRGGAGKMGDMLHAGNNLISLGRSRGLRCVLISQRAAKLHKDSLTQVETLIAARLIAPQDRKAVREWIADQADVDKGNEIIASLPKLAAGEAWAWAPEADFLKRIQFPKPRTFDSSASLSGKAASKKLPALDVKELDERFAKLKEETSASDPKELQKRVRELEAAAKKVPAKEKIVERAVADPAAEQTAFADGYKQGWSAYGEKIGIAFDAVLTAFERKHGDFKNPPPAPKYKRSGLQTLPSVNTPIKQAPAVRAASVVTPSAAGRGDGTLKGPEQKIVASLNFWLAIGEGRPTREQVAAVAGMSVRSSHYANTISKLKTAGHIDYPAGGMLALTDAGKHLEGSLDMDGATKMVASILKGPQVQIIAKLPRDGTSVPRDLLAAEAGFSATSSHFANTISSLKTLDILAYPESGRVCMTDWAAKVL